jgi:hypothetical protein
MEEGHHVEAEIIAREPKKKLIVRSHAADVAMGQGNDLWRRCRAGGVKQKSLFFWLRETFARFRQTRTAAELEDPGFGIALR